MLTGFTIICEDKDKYNEINMKINKSSCKTLKEEYYECLQNNDNIQKCNQIIEKLGTCLIFNML